MPAAIQDKYPWYIPFSVAMVRLAEAHARGVPFDLESSKQFSSDCLATILEAANQLIQIPEFAPLYSQLTDPRTGDTAELAAAWTKHAAGNGIIAPKAGSLRVLRAGGILEVEKLPAWNFLRKIRISKSAYRAVQQYQQAAAQDGRMHSLVTFRAATGRTTSNAPTLQNIPRDPRFRSLVRARPGHLIARGRTSRSPRPASFEAGSQPDALQVASAAAQPTGFQPVVV